jgi:hypothetical protein
MANFGCRDCRTPIPIVVGQGKNLTRQVMKVVSSTHFSIGVGSVVFVLHPFARPSSFPLHVFLISSAVVSFSVVWLSDVLLRSLSWLPKMLHKR